MGTKAYGISHRIYRFHFQGRVLADRTVTAEYASWAEGAETLNTPRRCNGALNIEQALRQ